MKRFLAWIAIATLFTVAAGAQQKPGTAAAGDNTALLLENNSMLYLELSKTIDAKKAKLGDPVSAVLLADVVSHGKIVLRTDSKLLGHVTEAQAHTQDNPESRLGIVFDKVIPKGGHNEIELSAVLMAVHPAPRLQIDPIAGPAPPGMNPAANPAPEKHYPTPKSPALPVPGSARDPGTKEDRDRMRHGEDIMPTDIEGISLEPSADKSNRVVVSYKRTVKLEGGMRLELRVVNSPVQKNVAQVP